MHKINSIVIQNDQVKKENLTTSKNKIWDKIIEISNLVISSSQSRERIKD
jgi:hypothetical protein